MHKCLTTHDQITQDYSDCSLIRLNLKSLKSVVTVIEWGTSLEQYKKCEANAVDTVLQKSMQFSYLNIGQFLPNLGPYMLVKCDRPIHSIHNKPKFYNKSSIIIEDRVITKIWMSTRHQKVNELTVGRCVMLISMCCLRIVWQPGLYSKI